MVVKPAPRPPPAGAGGDTIVRVDDIRMYFPVTSGIIFQRKVADVKAVDGVSFEIKRGETLGLVGETGCGEPTLGRVILMLYKPTSGEVMFEGQELTRMNPGDIRRMRRRMQMIFQDPYASLNPRMTIGSIIAEPIVIHSLAQSRNARRERGQGRGRGGAADVHRRRRAGVGAGRVDPGADHQPSGGAAGQLRPDLPVHRPRPLGRPAHQRPGGGDVPGPDGGANGPLGAVREPAAPH